MSEILRLKEEKEVAIAKARKDAEDFVAWCAPYIGDVVINEGIDTARNYLWKLGTVKNTVDKVEREYDAKIKKIQSENLFNLVESELSRDNNLRVSRGRSRNSDTLYVVKEDNFADCGRSYAYSRKSQIPRYLQDAHPTVYKCVDLSKPANNFQFRSGGKVYVRMEVTIPWNGIQFDNLSPTDVAKLKLYGLA